MPYFFKFIPTSCTGIKQTFGKFTGMLGSGLNFYIPIIQSIKLVSNRLEQNTFNFQVKTSDNVFTNLGIAVQHRIKPENSEKAFFSLDKPYGQINSYIENTIRAKVPKMELDELFQSQDTICHEVSATLKEKMEEYGFTIESTLITDIEPSKEVKDAMNQINASKRLKEAAQNNADADYITAIRKAEADKDRKRLQGEGISQQRCAILKGYEEGIDNMANKFGLSATDIINFVKVTQHLDTISEISKSPNTKTIFINHDPNHTNSNLSKNIMEATEANHK